SYRRACPSRNDAPPNAAAANASTPNAMARGSRHARQTGTTGLPPPTLPEAMAPRAAEKLNGANSEEIPNTREASSRLREVVATLRNAKNAPRRMSPIKASAKSGYRLRNTDSNSRGKPDQQITAANASQTLLASHTGAMACAMSARP